MRKDKISKIFLYLGVLGIILFLILFIFSINLVGFKTNSYIYVFSSVFIMMSLLLNFDSRIFALFVVITVLFSGLISILIFFFTGRKIIDEGQTIYSEKCFRIQLESMSPGITDVQEVSIYKYNTITEKKVGFLMNVLRKFL